MWLRGSCAHILCLPSFHYGRSNYIKLLCWGVGWTFWWLDRWVGGWMELPYERMHNLSVKSLLTVIRTPWEKSRQSFSDQNSTWTCSGIFTVAHSAGGVAFRTPIKSQLSSSVHLECSSTNLQLQSHLPVMCPSAPEASFLIPWHICKTHRTSMKILFHYILGIKTMTSLFIRDGLQNQGPRGE